MPLLNCPNAEDLLELVTIPNEISLVKRLSLKARVRFCASCREKVEKIENTWQGYFSPEPEITSSLLNVYSRLQKDETLILKGWKLEDARIASRRTLSQKAFQGGWLFRGGVSLAAAGLVAFIGATSLQQEETLNEVNMSASAEVPRVQIRIRDKDRVKVHYIQPKLLQTIEFETASAE